MECEELHLNPVRLHAESVQSLGVRNLRVESSEGSTPLVYLTQWRLVGNSEVIDGQILSCGDLQSDGKYHVLVTADKRVFDLPLDEPLRKVGEIADNLEFCTVSPNLWDEKWERNGISDQTGQNMSQGNRFRSVNMIRITEGDYYIHKPSGDVYFYIYDYEGNYLGTFDSRGSARKIVHFPDCFIRFKAKNDDDSYVYKNDICINVSNPNFNGEYYPYSLANSVLVRRKVGVKQINELKWLRGGTIESGLYGFYVDIPSKAPNTNISCLGYATINGTFVWTAPDMSIGSADNQRVYIKDLRYTEPTDFKAQDKEIFFELAEPFITSNISVPSIPLAKGYTCENEVPFSEFSAESVIQDIYLCQTKTILAKTK